MDFKRGLFRLWLVASVIWIAIIAAIAYSDTGIPSITKSCSSLQEFTDDKTGQKLGQAEIDACNAVWREERLTIASKAVVPPIAVLISGMILAWIGAGCGSCL